MINKIESKCKCCCKETNSEKTCGCGFQSQQNSNCGLEPFFCPRLRTYVLRGPRGFPGPRGPQGVPGVSPITSFVNLINPNLQVVGCNGNIIFTENAVSHGNAISHAAGSDVILLIPGAYFVSSILNFSSELSQVSFGLTLNSSPVQNPNIASSENGVISFSQIVMVNDNSNLAIQNFSSQSVTVENANMTILKIA